MTQIPTDKIRAQIEDLDALLRWMFTTRTREITALATWAAFASDLDRPYDQPEDRQRAEKEPALAALDMFDAWCRREGASLRARAKANIPRYSAALPGPHSEHCARRAAALWLWRQWAEAHGAGDLVPTPAEAKAVWERKARGPAPASPTGA